MMNEVELTKKDYKAITSRAIDNVNNNASKSSLEIFKVESIVKALIGFCNKCELVIANGKVYRPNKEQYDKEFKILYDKLETNYKYEFVVKRDKADLLNRLQTAEKELEKLRIKASKERSRNGT